MKKTLCLLLSAALCLSILGCDAGDDAQREEIPESETVTAETEIQTEATQSPETETVPEEAWPETLETEI